MKRRDRNQNKSKTDFKFYGTIALAAFSPMMLAFIPWDASTTVTQATEGLLELDAKVNAQIVKQGVGYTKTIADSTSILNEAIKTTVSQEALSATQLGVADKRAKQVEVVALEAQKISDDVINVQLNFGASTGQGHNVCQVYSENKQLDAAFDSAIPRTDNKVNQLDNSPGKMAVSQKAAIAAREDVHKKFCSAEEKSQGKCPTTSKLAGADSNANVLFVSSKPGSDMAAAKAAVRQNILGTPDLAVPRAVGGSVAAQAYLANVNRKTALSAFPAYSLAYLDSMSEVRDDLKTKEGVPQSPNDVLFKTVTRYYGGPDAAEWQKSMVAQQPRGMLVELAKMEGLGAWMDHQEYLANQRLEGNIAAMTLVTALPMEEDLNRQKNTMTRNNIKGGF